MSSFLCFICHSTVNSGTNEDMREKYREVVGMNLCPDSHLCHVCCHVLNRLWLFRAICLKRSLEYPVLFSEKGTINLQRNDLEIYTLCSEDTCEHYRNRNMNSKFYQYSHFNEQLDSNDKHALNEYVQLHEEFDDVMKYNNDFNVELSNFDNVKNFNNVPDIDPNNFNVYDYNNEEVNNGDIVDDNIEGVNEEENTIEEDNGEEVDLEENPETSNKKSKLKKRGKFERINLTVKEQKVELEAKRRNKKYIEAEFKCSNCAIGFLFKDTYQAHMMRHEESNGEYRCTICTLRFATPAVLRAHTALHAERFRCVACSTLVSRRRKAVHLTDCGGAPQEGAPCHLCGRVLKNSSGLQQHLKRFHRSEATGRSYACNVCGKRYNNQAAVRTHMIKHIQRKFNCDECTATFSSPYTLKQHQKKHSSLPEEVFVCGTCCTTYSSRKNLLAHHRNVHQKESLQCPKCPRMCPNKHALTSHLATHTQTRVSCPNCPATCPSARSLRRHMEKHRQIAPQLAVCHMCGAAFKGKNKLNRHIREVCQKNKLEEQLSSYYAEEDLT